MTVSYNSFGYDRKPAIGVIRQEEVLIPANTLSEGVSPAGRFIVAPYLPLLRNSENLGFTTQVVISSGKIVAIDSKGQIVPAGLRLEAEAYVTGGDAGALVKYTVKDVEAEVRNFKGDIVTDGEPVVKSWFTRSTLDNKISYFVGVTQYDCLRHAGGDNINPATIRNINMNPQPVIAFLSDYHMQYPVVKDVDTIRSAPLKGIAGVVATPDTLTFGTFITYDRESNFVPCDDLHGYGTTKLEAVVGQVTGLRVYKDHTTNAVTGNHNLLNKVVAPNAATASVLNQVPNSRNDGLGTFITYSNGYAIAEFGIQTR